MRERVRRLEFLCHVDIKVGVGFLSKALFAPIVTFVAWGRSWVSGYWRNDGRAYVWIPGRWDLPPRGYREWESPRWERRDRGYIFIEGHWR